MEPEVNVGRLAIFVDGRNLIGVAKALFPENDFAQRNLLPPNANWGLFFKSIYKSLTATEMKVYWYFVEEFEFIPDIGKTGPPYRNPKEAICAKQRKSVLLHHIKSKKKVRDQIANVQIRLAGWQRCNLGDSEPRFGREKAIDTAIAGDMIYFLSNYDTSLLVSGDGDYVPILRLAKAEGKKTGGFQFYKKNKKPLKQTALRLQHEFDFTFDVEYRTMRTFMRP